MWYAKEQKMHGWFQIGSQLSLRFKLYGIGFPSWPDSLPTFLASSYPCHQTSVILNSLCSGIFYIRPLTCLIILILQVLTQSALFPESIPWSAPISNQLPAGQGADVLALRHPMWCLSQDLLYRIIIYLAPPSMRTVTISIIYFYHYILSI